MAKNILKEAIADAKAVREVALANAKAALEEAFTPKLQNMLSARLAEDLDDISDEKEIELGEMGGMHYDEDEDIGDEGSMDDEIDLEEILNELESDDDDTADDEEPIEEMDSPTYTADSVQRNHQYKAEYVNEAFDLDSLLKEINDLEDEEEILEIEDDEDEEIYETKNQVSIRFRGTNEVVSRCRGCVAENKKIKSLQTQLNESTSAYNTVRNELNEVNLLNSKLLYVNRIFKANNLSEKQKLSVVETLDKATSVKESKLIYETIKDTFTISTKKKKKVYKKPIRENFGMASKATRTSAPRKPILKESNNMVARMQKLANISKIKE